MRESKQTQIPKKKKAKEEDLTATPASSISSEEKKHKLKELDDFMEGVLEKAGEEFLDEFKQVEGE